MRNLVSFLTLIHAVATVDYSYFHGWYLEEKECRLREFINKILSNEFTEDEFEKVKKNYNREDVLTMINLYYSDVFNNKADYYNLILKAKVKGVINNDDFPIIMKCLKELTAEQIRLVISIHNDIPFKGLKDTHAVNERRIFMSTLQNNSNPLIRNLIQTLIFYGMFNIKDGTRPAWASELFYVFAHALNDCSTNTVNIIT